MLDFQPVQPGHLAGTFQPGPGGLAEGQEMGSMPVMRFLPLAALMQPFRGVIADGPQQRERTCPARSAWRTRLASTRELSVSRISAAWSWLAGADPSAPPPAAPSRRLRSQRGAGKYGQAREQRPFGR